MATDYGLLTARLRWIQDHSDELEEGDGQWRLGKKMATLALPDSALVVDRLSEKDGDELWQLTEAVTADNGINWGPLADDDDEPGR